MSRDVEAKKVTRSGPLEDLLNLVTAGYGRKEDLRALDKELRDGLYSELMTLHRRWEKLCLGVLDAGQTSTGKNCKAAIQSLDLIAAKIQRGDYGYAPLFDRVNKIQEEALSKLLDHDRNLVDNLTALSEDVRCAEEALKSSTWKSLDKSVEKIRDDLSILEDGWEQRKRSIKR